MEGIGCAACHRINGAAEQSTQPPTFKISSDDMIYGPYADAEENLVHPSTKSDLFKGANYCTACHFDKVKDVTRPDLPGEILHGTVCQDCHMEQSTGSSTSKRGSMTRSIGRHWFRGVVIPGIMLKNRNLQAEWMPRVDLEVTKGEGSSRGDASRAERQSSAQLPGRRSDLEQYFMTVTVKDAKGVTIASDVKQVGVPFEQILRGEIPEPLVKGGTTRRLPFSLGAVFRDGRAGDDRGAFDLFVNSGAVAGIESKILCYASER